MIHPWQEKILNGIRKGEMCIWASGRQTGKSQLTQYMAQWQELMGEKCPYKTLTQASVDGVMWYTVKCNSEVSHWLREHQSNNCYQHIDQSWYIDRNTFDVSEAVYIQMGLKWS